MGINCADLKNKRLVLGFFYSFPCYPDVRKGRRSSCVGLYTCTSANVIYILCFTSPPTQHHSFFREYPLCLFVIYRKDAIKSMKSSSYEKNDTQHDFWIFFLCCPSYAEQFQPRLLGYLKRLLVVMVLSNFRKFERFPLFEIKPCQISSLTRS